MRSSISLQKRSCTIRLSRKKCPPNSWRAKVRGIFECTILGACQSKANSRRAVAGGRFIKSQAALEFERDALIQIRHALKNRNPIGGDVGIEVTIWYRSKRSDLSPELVFDCLQKAGVLFNDRQIREYSARKEWDKTRPRAQLTVYPLED